MHALNAPLHIKNLTLRNRLVLPPLTTNYGDENGLVTEAIRRFYQERAREIGMVIVEATAVSANGRIVPGSLGLWQDAQTKGMAALAAVIKKEGAAAVVQLNHAGARCVPRKSGRYGLSPSGTAFRADVEPVVMDQADIEQLTADFTSAALRAADAGFDGVEIHGAHFYLLSQFISPLTNQRTDAYGGDAGGRARVPLYVVQQVRRRLGSDYPVLFRLNAVENIAGGQTLEDALTIGGFLAQAGVDILDVSLIVSGAFKIKDGKRLLTGSSALPKDAAAGANVVQTEAFKTHTGLPVIAVGKLGSPEVIQQALAAGRIDMIAVGRQMICDPSAAGKLLRGAQEPFAPCQECYQCYASIGRGDPLQCKVNPALPGSNDH